MKKSIVLLILLAACKQTETTNETTTTMTATESSATVATVAPTPPAPLPTQPAPATSAIETMGTNPAAKPPTATTATTQTAPSTAPPANAPPPALVPKTPMPQRQPATKSDTAAPSASTISAIETMGTNPNPPASTPPPTLASEGMSVFKSHGCAMCHGASGAGDTAMGTKNNIHDFRSAAVQSQTDEQLVKTIREGKGPVSASAHKAKALSAEQARSVVAWIRSLK